MVEEGVVDSPGVDGEGVELDLGLRAEFERVFDFVEELGGVPVEGIVEFDCM